MTVSQEELDPATHDAIKAHSAKGDEFAAAQAFEEAIAEYDKAWALLPNPKNEWNASTWILAAIADAAFLAGYKTSAREALQYAMTCPGAIGNLFLHLRYGQILMDAGELDAAANELMRAYMAEGSGIFAAEDPRYLDFLKTRANLWVSADHAPEAARACRRIEPGDSSETASRTG
jgi:tetratricopeptide (TPR) repeat protein